MTLAETLGLNRFNPDYYALELGNHVLGGGFYATRFYRDLREKGGLVYTVSSSFNVGRDARRLRGSIRLRSPQRLQGAQHRGARFEGHADRPCLRTHELEQAKALLLREIPLSESSVDSHCRRDAFQVN